MKIEIKSAEVKSREVSSSSTGKAFLIRSQAAVMRGAEEVKKFDMALGDGQSYEAGLYEIGSESFVIDAYGRLSLARNLTLVKVGPSQANK